MVQNRRDHLRETDVKQSYPVDWMALSHYMLSMWFVAMNCAQTYQWHCFIQSMVLTLCIWLLKFMETGPFLLTMRRPPNPANIETTDERSEEMSLNTSAGILHNKIPLFYRILHTGPFALYTAPSEVMPEKVNQVLAQHPKCFLSHIGTASFTVIWDTGATMAITHEKADFIGEIAPTKIPLTLGGIASGLRIEGVGMVEWGFIANDGSFFMIKIPVFHVPTSSQCILYDES